MPSIVFIPDSHCSSHHRGLYGFDILSQLSSSWAELLMFSSRVFSSPAGSHSNLRVFFPRGSETECLKVTLQNLRARRLHQPCAAVRCARTSAQIVFHTPTTVADHDESMSYRNFAAWTGPGALAVRGPCLSRPPMHSCSSLHFFSCPSLTPLETGYAASGATVSGVGLVSVHDTHVTGL